MKKPDKDNVLGEDHEIGEISNIRLLWRACVAQALRDLVCANVDDALDAAQWVGTEDYKEVCDNASIDSGWLEQRIRAAMAMKDPYRRYHIVKLSQQINIGLTSGDSREA